MAGSGRWRAALVAGLLALGSVAASSASEPTGGDVLVLRGDRHAVVDVTLTAPLRFAPTLTLTQATFAGEEVSRLGRGDGPYLGYAIYDLATRELVRGHVEIPGYAGVFDGPVTWSLAFSRQERDELAPGDYRLVLLAEGPTEVRLPVVAGTPPPPLTATAPADVTGGFVDVTRESGAVQATARVPVTEAPGARDFSSRALRAEQSAVGESGSCKRDRDAAHCPPVNGNRSSGILVSSGEARAGATLSEVPSSSEGGRFDIEWRNGIQSDGEVPMRALNLRIGPGPLPRPVDAACPDDRVPNAGFSDVPGTVHAAAVDCLAWYAIARGDGQRFGPGAEVRRDQMASLVVRLLDQAGVVLPDEDQAPFEDTAGNTHERAIAQLAALGIVRGAGERFRPAAPLSRGQLAALLNRAHDVADRDLAGVAPREVEDERRLRTDAVFFDDVVGTTHADDVHGLAQFGVVAGVAPGRFAPGASVTRGQAASMLARELDVLTVRGRSTTPDDVLPAAVPRPEPWVGDR